MGPLKGREEAGAHDNCAIGGWDGTLQCRPVPSLKWRQVQPKSCEMEALYIFENQHSTHTGSTVKV